MLKKIIIISYLSFISHISIAQNNVSIQEFRNTAIAEDLNKHVDISEPTITDIDLLKLHFDVNVNNKEIYKTHHIIITKEEKTFFFGNTKEVLVQDIMLSGINTFYHAGKSFDYIKSIIKEENKEDIIIKDKFETGITISISKNHSGQQILNFEKIEFVKFNEVAFDAVEFDGLKIQLPQINIDNFSTTILSEVFDLKWTDSQGVVYHLRYNGQKTLPKS